MKYYCISLRETPERTARVQAEFEREGVPVTWVWGVYGKSMRIKSEIPMHSDYYVTRGATALVLSHHFAWNLAQHADEVRSLTEQAARALLLDGARELGCGWVALGHTAQDQAEGHALHRQVLGRRECDRSRGGQRSVARDQVCAILQAVDPCGKGRFTPVDDLAAKPEIEQVFPGQLTAGVQEVIQHFETVAVLISIHLVADAGSFDPGGEVVPDLVGGAGSGQ